MYTPITRTIIFFLMRRRPTRSTLFPYTTLFRSRRGARPEAGSGLHRLLHRRQVDRLPRRDRKSTRLHSSHVESSYARFCLKKKDVIGETAIPMLIANVFDIVLCSSCVN